MQVGDATRALYQKEAPHLLDAVQEEHGGFVMRRNPETNYCIKFDQGWCGIQREHGEKFLGDACYFFPRITRALGDHVFTSAALSCPETARLMLFSDAPLERTAFQPTRLPHHVRQYLPEVMDTATALTLHDRFLSEAAHPEFSAEINLLRALSVACALDTLSVTQWEDASRFYFRIADTRIPAAQPVAEDPFNLVHALHGLMLASKAPQRSRLATLRDHMTQSLGITLNEDPGFITTASDAPARFASLRRFWQQSVGDRMQPLFTRYFQAQLSGALFPFAGFGQTLAERMAMLGVRFAMVKLALMCDAYEQQHVPDDATVVRIVQTLSRFLDHLGDSALSLQICKETGWLQEERLRGLLQA